MNEIETMMSIAQKGRKIRARKKYTEFLRGKSIVLNPKKAPETVRAPKKKVLDVSGKKWCKYGRHSVDKDNFNKHATSPDGLCYKCKPCQSHYQAMWKSGFLEKFKSLQV